MAITEPLKRWFRSKKRKLVYNPYGALTDLMNHGGILCGIDGSWERL